MAPWIIPQLPPHRVYVEPFGGGGSILLRKPRSYSEVYNDLEVEICNVFRVLRDPHMSNLLITGLALTPYARDEFEESYLPTEDPVEQARRTFIRCTMGFGSTGFSKEKTGFRASCHRQRATPMHGC